MRSWSGGPRAHEPFRGVELRIVKGLEEGEEAVASFEPDGSQAGSLDSPQRSFFHREIGFDVQVGGDGVFVTQPESDDGNVHSGLEQMHRGGVPQRVWRDPASVEGRASLRRLPDGDAQALLYARPGKQLTRAIGEDGRIRAAVTVDASEPCSQLPGGTLPQWDHALLAALAVQMKSGSAIEEHIGDAQIDDLGYTRAGVVEHGEQYGIAPTTPGGAVRCIEQGLDLFAR